MTNSDDVLADIRRRLEAPDAHASALAQLVRKLDAHLSAGGAPPEAWREGPDAPELDDASQHEDDDNAWGFTADDHTPETTYRVWRHVP